MLRRTTRLFVAALFGLGAAIGSSAHADPTPVIDGVKVKWVNLEPTQDATTPQVDYQHQLATLQSPATMDCTHDPCWTSKFKYRPAASLSGNDRDVLVTVSSSGIYNDIDLFVLDPKGKPLGSCGRAVSNQEQVYLPYTSLKRRKTYTVVVEFVTTLPKATASSGGAVPFHTQGEVQMPSPVHSPFTDQNGQHALNSCGSDSTFP